MSDLLKPGQIFAGRYRVERFLAEGGFGAVYEAEQTETELRVALKILWPHVLQSRDAVERFKLEARVAGRVGSEHIVKVFDAGFDEGTRMPFLVMELLRGSDLETVIETNGPLATSLVVDYLRQIASALDRAHGYVDRDGVRRPIVHRDLKPENLYLAERDPGGPIVKILDFGVAKIVGESTNISQDVKGTPLYMAFEQASAGRITPQTDIWPLGLIAFFLLTGKKYWGTANLPESTLTQLFGEVLSLPIVSPSERAREIGATVTLPPAFDAWFTGCVNRDPSARFPTAGQCAQELALALGEAGRNDAAALGATIAAPSAAGSNASPSLSNRVSTAQSSPYTATSDASVVVGSVSAARSGKRSWFVWGFAAILVLGAGGAFVFASASTNAVPSAERQAAMEPAEVAPSARSVTNSLPAPAAPSAAELSVTVAPASTQNSPDTTPSTASTRAATPQRNTATAVPRPPPKAVHRPSGKKDDPYADR